jgi:hypothetical protein
MPAEILEIIVFQFQWWLCVLNKEPYLHFGYILALLTAVSIILYKYRSYKKIVPIILLTCVGILNDSGLMALKLFNFPGFMNTLLIPFWLMALWFCFAAWFVEAKWLHRKYLLSGLLCMFGGPLSYLAGDRFGAIVFSQIETYKIVLWGIDWFLLGLFFVIAVRWFEMRARV